MWPRMSALAGVHAISTPFSSGVSATSVGAAGGVAVGTIATRFEKSDLSPPLAIVRMAKKRAVAGGPVGDGEGDGEAVGLGLAAGVALGAGLAAALAAGVALGNGLAAALAA